MAVLEDQEYLESDCSENEEQHSKLVNFVSQLDSTQRVKPALRKEASSEVSEYNLTRGSLKRKTLVDIKELAQVLGKKSGHAEVTEKLKEVTRNKRTLPKPLEKPVEERIKRSVGFENVKTQLRKWDAIVTRNALKDHIKFPLNDNTMRLQPSNVFLKQFKTSTPLEMEIAKILKQDTNLEEDEEKDEFPLTLEEMMEKRKEMAQLRAKLSYREAKAQRQSKIKSKKYHRILKREKIRQQLKEFELLQKTDPEAALKKLAELDKSRAQERASLRHRNTGQWAKNKAVRAKYDVESRKVLADQLKISREITQKAQICDSSEEDVNESQPTPNSVNNNSTFDKDNPWSISVSEEVSNFVNDYKKYWSNQNKEVKQSREDSTKEIFKKKDDSSESEKTCNALSANEEDNSLKKEIKSSDVNGLTILKCKKSKLKKSKTSVGDGDLSPKTHNNSLEKEIKSNKKNAIEILKRKKPKLKKSKTRSAGNGRVSPEARKSRLNKHNSTSVRILPASGVWIVTSVAEENHSTKKEVDIDVLFDDLNEELLKKGAKKVKEIKKRVKQKERKRKRAADAENKDEEIDLSLKQTKAIERPDVDVELLEGNENENVTGRYSLPVTHQTSTVYTPAEIDPKNFIEVKPKKLNTHLPDNITGGDDALDDETVQQMTIEEAFCDDDVLAEFQEMKKAEESALVEISTSLPGWGEWGGVGIVPNKRKSRRLILNLPPRKDKEKKDVIINENENPNLRKHLVKDVPHPFKSVDAFEANIRAPVGRDWVPETAHQNLIKKQVETKLGTVIEPMDEDEIVRLKKKSKCPYQGKKKSKEN